MYRKTNIQNEILKERGEKRSHCVSFILLANPEEGGQSCLWMMVVPFTCLGTHTAEDITTWKVHPTFNFCDSSGFHMVITLPRHTSFTRWEYFTYIFVILGRELVFSSQCNLHECEITSSMQYSHWTCLKLIIVMNFAYLLSPRGRLHFLLIKIKIHSHEIVLQHNTLDKCYPGTSLLSHCKRVAQYCTVHCSLSNLCS